MSTPHVEVFAFALYQEGKEFYQVRSTGIDDGQFWTDDSVPVKPVNAVNISKIQRHLTNAFRPRDVCEKQAKVSRETWTEGELDGYAVKAGWSERCLKSRQYPHVPALEIDFPRLRTMEDAEPRKINMDCDNVKMSRGSSKGKEVNRAALPEDQNKDFGRQREKFRLLGCPARPLRNSGHAKD